MISDDTLTAKLQSYLGAEADAELRGIAKDTLAQTEGGHLGSNVSPNIIFVPGVMGSLLSSRLGGVWWIDARTRSYINSLRLAPDGQTDATPELLWPFLVLIRVVSWIICLLLYQSHED